jgi:hypothetical protein
MMYLYRAVADCSACGTVVDVGPFDLVETAVESMLPGWLLPSTSPVTFRDKDGTPIGLCDVCAAPVYDILRRVQERRLPVSQGGSRA